MFRTKTLVLIAFLALAACAAHTAPEDAQMANSLCAQAKGLLTSGKTSEARDLYSSAVKRDRLNARAWNGLGVANDLLGKRDEAKDAYENALNLVPNDITATNNLAHLYLESGKPEKTIELLQPYANDRSAPPTLRQNLAAATKAVQDKPAAKEDTADVYAELGSYPTEGMAQGHLREAQGLLGGKAKDLNFSVEPEVKTGGGVPTFTAKISGRKPQDICDALSAQAIPCIPHGK